MVLLATLSRWNYRQCRVVRARDVSSRNDARRTQDMLFLIIKKYVRSERIKYGSFVSYTDEMSFVCRGSPSPQGVNNSRMRGCVPSSHNGDANFANALIVHMDFS